MNSFISRIVQRHLQSENNIKPRLQGKFESFNASQNQGGTDMLEPDGFYANSYEQTKNLSDGDFFEKSVTKNNENSHAFDIYGNHDKIVNGSNLFSMPESAPIELNTTNRLEENKNGAARKNSIGDSNNREKDRDIVSGPEDFSDNNAARRNLIADTNSNFSVQGNTASFAGEERLFKEEVSPERFSYLVPQNNRDVKANERHVFFENKEQKTPPTIKVSIGKIEIRAITSSVEAKKENNTPQKPIMSLDEYLNKRNDKK